MGHWTELSSFIVKIPIPLRFRFPFPIPREEFSDQILKEHSECPYLWQNRRANLKDQNKLNLEIKAQLIVQIGHIEKQHQ